MKNILGLDLGTNSIAWALVNSKSILGLGDRIIPMDASILNDFSKGVTQSQAALRTGYRSTRRLIERHLLRRERLHRVLNVIGFLPEHYSDSIDFVNKLGKFKTNESKLAYKPLLDNKYEFIFNDSYNEMLADFSKHQPELVENDKKVPRDWTIYYLRKKALEQAVTKYELAWILLSFNQKRGYYQLRGEDEDETPNKTVDFHSLKVISVKSLQTKRGFYSVELENGWIYEQKSFIPIFDWEGKTKEYIVTTEFNDDGTIKTDREGNEVRKFRVPDPNDWTLVKKKTEADLEKSTLTVGTYIYNVLLENPNQKIRGKLIRTIERKFYKAELEAIFKKQKDYHTELVDADLYKECVTELYKNNTGHQQVLASGELIKLFINDIIFYQRPLKSKKSLIANCLYEGRKYKDKKTDEEITKFRKCIAKSHPLYQEFRLWQFVQNLRIYQHEKIINGKPLIDYDVTADFIKGEDDIVALYEWLNERKEITQETLLKTYFKIKVKKGEPLPYRWNFVEERAYPCNETRAEIKKCFTKVNQPKEGFDYNAIEEQLWHILYSVEDRIELRAALGSFAIKHKFGTDFVDQFSKFPSFKKDYGAYSHRAISRMLPLMRMGKYWDINTIDEHTRLRIDKLITGEFDANILNRVREKSIHLTSIESFKALPLWLVCYIIYNRHSESGEAEKWESPADIDKYLNTFKQHSLRNPIVEGIVTETLRVVRDVWRKYGTINEIHIELGRDLKNPAEKRKSINTQVLDNEATNRRIKILLSELANDRNIKDVRPYSPNQQEILKIYEEGVLSANADNLPDDVRKISKLPNPTKAQIDRYKMWLEQGYRSPYTGAVIPLSELFTTKYQIEHIIPQAHFYDNSFTNKIICEAAVNGLKKDRTAYNFIKNSEGLIVELGHGEKVKIFTLAEYEQFVQRNYEKLKQKKTKLLMEDIPQQFTERQMNDSRYISRLVMRLLSNIVRDEDEKETTSKHVIPCNGVITSKLKQDWGINDVWNKLIAPRFERLNTIDKKNTYGYWDNKDGKRVFQINLPVELDKGLVKKRIDHRHHAMDALVIACANRNIVNYLSNQSAKSERSRYDLRDLLCSKNKNNKWQFHKPWETFTFDVQTALQNLVVSFKQNLRVINKSTNNYQRYNQQGEKRFEKQTKGDNIAIRKPLHKATVYGKVNLRLIKTVTLTNALDSYKDIVDKKLKNKIKALVKEGYDKKKIANYLNDPENGWDKEFLSKIEVYYFSDTNEKESLVANRVVLDTSFNLKRIEKVTDLSIQKILIAHLNTLKYQNQFDDGGKIILPEQLAFSPEGIVDMNNNIQQLNGGASHKPIYNVRVYEILGKKFKVGEYGSKIKKYVETEKGTNLYFAIYVDQKGERSFESVPLNDVIARLKDKLSPVLELSNGNQLLFYLSPNDLVYVPTLEEQEQANNLQEFTADKIYKMVSTTRRECYFVPHTIAFPIVDTIELGSNNKSERPWSNLSDTGFDQEIMIKKTCIKLKINRLGELTRA